LVLSSDLQPRQLGKSQAETSAGRQAVTVGVAADDAENTIDSVLRQRTEMDLETPPAHSLKPARTAITQLLLESGDLPEAHEQLRRPPETVGHLLLERRQLCLVGSGEQRLVVVETEIFVFHIVVRDERGDRDLHLGVDALRSRLAPEFVD